MVAHIVPSRTWPSHMLILYCIYERMPLSVTKFSPRSKDGWQRMAINYYSCVSVDCNLSKKKKKAKAMRIIQSTYLHIYTLTRNKFSPFNRLPLSFLGPPSANLKAFPTRRAVLLK